MTSPIGITFRFGTVDIPEVIEDQDLIFVDAGDDIEERFFKVRRIGMFHLVQQNLLKSFVLSPWRRCLQLSTGWTRKYLRIPHW